MSQIFINGVKKDASDQELGAIIKHVFLQSTNNLSWLRPGQTVLLKPAINSFFPYPATTHPLAVSVISEILLEHGAKVIVGDQSGVEHVVQGEGGMIKGDSEFCFQQAGGEAVKDVNFIALEKRGWNGYHNFTSAKTGSWPSGFFISDIIKEVNHVISLPRLSTHSQAGVSLGFKNLVGLLRLDSRLEFHTDGPFNFFIQRFGKKSKIQKYKKQDKFFEKMVEISAAVEDKLRLTLFVGTKAQVNLGPDKYVISKILASKVAEPETGLVLASDSQVGVEAAALAFLTYLYKNSPLPARLLEKILLFFNGQAKELGRQSVWDNPFVKHGLKINLGSKDNKIGYIDVPDDLQRAINQLTL